MTKKKLFIYLICMKLIQTLNYFGGGLIMLKPKKVSYINSDTFQMNIYKSNVRISFF